jgi:two-component system nitrate/nitrite sensor histidine kinase NarX
VLTLLADAGAIALENARTYERAEQEARLLERERILAEIHDGLAQTLSFLGLRLDTAQAMIEREELSEVPDHLALTRRAIVQAEREVRRLMQSLQGEESVLSLQEQLRQAIVEFSSEHRVRIEVEFGLGPPILEQPEVSEQVRRVLLEALTNVEKHAPYSLVAVTLDRREGRVSLCVRDDGPGFEPERAHRRQGHFGLKVMQARAERIGGILSIQSAPGEGTAVTLCWPVQA